MQRHQPDVLVVVRGFDQRMDGVECSPVNSGQMSAGAEEQSFTGHGQMISECRFIDLNRTWLTLGEGRMMGENGTGDSGGISAPTDVGELTEHEGMRREFIYCLQRSTPQLNRCRKKRRCRRDGGRRSN